MKLFRTQDPTGTSKRRSGLSLLEFLGCLIAVVGGAWLGALCLGINLQHVAYTALEEADLLETVPESWIPDAPNGKDKLHGMSREQMVSTLRKELVALRQEISSLRGTNGVNGEATDTNGSRTAGSSQPVDLSQPTKEKTLAYWNRLSEIALGEAALQRDAELAFTDENAGKVLIIKGRVSRFAANAVHAIPREQVDPRLLLLGKELADWYSRGGDLYEQAVQIYSFPSENASRDRLTKEWRQDDTQHHNEAQFLSNRAIHVRDELRRTFGEEFPAFGQPTTTSSPSEDESKGESKDEEDATG